MAIKYDYDAFSLPFDGMKIPEWVNSAEAPVDAMGIYNKEVSRQQQQKAEDIQQLVQSLQMNKALQAMDKQDRVEKGMSQVGEWLKANPNAPMKDLYGNAVTNLLGNGSFAEALQFEQARRQLLQDEVRQTKEEKAAQLREFSSLAGLARLNPQAAQAALQAGVFENLGGFGEAAIKNPSMMVPLRKGKEGKGAKEKMPSFVMMVDPKTGEVKQLDRNNPEHVREAKEGGYLPTTDIQEMTYQLEGMKPKKKPQAEVPKLPVQPTGSQSKIPKAPKVGERRTVYID